MICSQLAPPTFFRSCCGFLPLSAPRGRARRCRCAAMPFLPPYLAPHGFIIDVAQRATYRAGEAGSSQETANTAVPPHPRRPVNATSLSTLPLSSQTAASWMRRCQPCAAIVSSDSTTMDRKKPLPPLPPPRFPVAACSGG